jgi:hypothetical protein
MITFTALGQYGRLGNQLFQYAILLVVGAKRGYEIKISLLNNKYWHGQKCLLNNFNITAKELTTDDLIKHEYIEKEVDYFKYNPEIFNIQDNTNIFGFFQNYQYYKNHENLIIRELTPKDEIIQKNKEILLKIKEKYPDYLIVSLHIRRGDTKLTMYGNENILDVNSKWFQYFSRAKKIFEGKKCKFLVFTGGNRTTDDPTSDYIWCKNNLKTDEYIYWKYENTTINDFTLMYLSDAHILSPISSLSWWIGFLNKNNNKIIVSPEKYRFLEEKMEDGFYPPNFILK